MLVQVETVGLTFGGNTQESNRVYSQHDGHRDREGRNRDDRTAYSLSYEERHAAAVKQPRERRRVVRCEWSRCTILAAGE